MNYVLVAYVLAIALIGGYALSVVARRREVERSMSAWSERSAPRNESPGDGPEENEPIGGRGER